MAHIGQQSDRGSPRNRRGPLGQFGLLLSQVSSRPPFRLILFGLLSTGWFAAVLVCLWDYQVRQVEHFNQRAKKQHEGTIEIRAARIYSTTFVRVVNRLPLSTSGFVDVFPRPRRARKVDSFKAGVVRLEIVFRTSPAANNPMASIAPSMLI